MVIAHRGVYNNIDIPENSMMAFKNALNKRYDIEMDIQITKDNKIVVFHDDNLKRMTGVKRNIEDCTYGEIEKLNLLNTNEKIPLFSDVLNLIDGKVLLDIEIKDTKRVKQVCELVLNELKEYNGNILLKSFNPFIVRKLKKKSNYKVGLLISKKNYNKVLLNFLTMTKIIYLFDFDFIAIDKKMLSYRYYNKYIKKYPIYIWTFNGIDEANKYIDKYPNVNVICNKLNNK